MISTHRRNRRSLMPCLTFLLLVLGACMSGQTANRDQVILDHLAVLETDTAALFDSLSKRPVAPYAVRAAAYDSLSHDAAEVGARAHARSVSDPLAVAVGQSPTEVFMTDYARVLERLRYSDATTSGGPTARRISLSRTALDDILNDAATYEGDLPPAPQTGDAS